MASGEYPIDRDELLTRIELADVLNAVTTGHGDGRRRTWNCPDTDHPDVHPSVTIHTDRRGVQRWRCWSGGHGGTAIDAVIAARHLSVGDAINWLAEHHTHLEPVQRDPPVPTRPVGRPAPEVLEYVDRCAKLLWTPAGRDVRKWLNGRGYPDDLLAANRVGADPGRRYLPRPKGLPAGWPAAVYPALDPGGQVTYFQARHLDPPAGRGKYDNPASLWATNPRLGWTRSVTDVRPAQGRLIITEGIADALTAARLGHHAVGILGANLFTERAAHDIGSELRRTGGGAIVCFDADEAGRAGAARVIDRLTHSGLDQVAQVEPPAGFDLTDWVRRDYQRVTLALNPTPSASAGRLPGPGHSLV